MQRAEATWKERYDALLAKYRKLKGDIRRVLTEHMEEDEPEEVAPTSSGEYMVGGGGDADGGGGDDNIGAVPLETVLHWYEQFLTERTRVFETRIVRTVPVWGVRLTWDRIFREIVRLCNNFPGIFRIACNMGFIIEDQRDRDFDVFFANVNTNIFDNVDMLTVNPARMSESLDVIRGHLVRASQNNYMNRLTLEYAKKSQQSIAMPLYIQFVCLLLQPQAARKAGEGPK